MPEPTKAQPYFAFPGLRISVGDPDAANGTNAQRGVIILDNGIPVGYIIQPNTPFQVQAQVRAALAGAPFPLNLTVQFRVFNLNTGAPVGVPINAAAVNPIVPAPTGDTPAATFEFITWTAYDSPPITLPAGEYRVTVRGIGGNVFFLHDDTPILVQP